MKRLKLTKETQKTRFLEDVERINAGRRPDFSIGDHLLMLMRRVEALEAQLRDSDRSGEADETGTGSAVGESAGPQDIAQPQSGDPH